MTALIGSYLIISIIVSYHPIVKAASFPAFEFRPGEEVFNHNPSLSIHSEPEKVGKAVEKATQEADHSKDLQKAFQDFVTGDLTEKQIVDRLQSDFPKYNQYKEELQLHPEDAGIKTNFDKWKRTVMEDLNLYYSIKTTAQILKRHNTEQFIQAIHSIPSRAYSMPLSRFIIPYLFFIGASF